MPATTPRIDDSHRVDAALHAEGAHELVALQADRAQHAELALPLVGEHHEDVDEQQDAGDHAERADAAEELRELRGDVVGLVEQVLL